MPIHPTYPGVYIEEIPSGVHTITGVATSITAFLGQALRGPINKAVHILSLKDYERSFGGLSVDSDMSYAVSQFFLNGGSEAYVVRLAKGARTASATLLDKSGTKVLTITALDEGTAGNAIQLLVNPISSSNFDLTVSYVSATNSADNRTELFQNLSLDPTNSRFIEDLINGISQLVTVAVIGTNIPTKLAPMVISGAFTDSDLEDTLHSLPDTTHNSFMIGFNGHTAELVSIDHNTPGDSSSLATYLDDIASRIQKAVKAVHTDRPVWNNFTCTSDGTHLIFSTSESDTASSVVTSSIAVTDTTGSTDSIFKALHLDNVITNQKGISLASAHGSITSGEFLDSDLAALSTLPNATHNSSKIGFDGNAPVNKVIIDSSAITASNLADYLTQIASRIQKATRATNPGVVAYKNFTCISDGKHLILSSGTSGPASSVQVVDANFTVRGLLDPGNVTVNKPDTPGLSGGAGDSFAEDGPDALKIYSGDPVQRTGIQALEAVDLFNLLCLPGVTQPGILTMAVQYCQFRRAFLIVDAPLAPPDPTKPGPQSLKPAEMVTHITGPELPKGDLGTYAAIYYPRLQAPDSLKGGKLRSFAPSGMIAGLYARTDGSRGVWKAPAGTDATLIGVQGLDYVLTDAENGTLNPHGVNCLRIFPVFGPVSWGARTVSGDDQIGSEYKYIPVRRTALYIEESLYRGLKWVVFEPNDEPLWAQIRLNVGAFMQNLFRQGAFQGQSPRDAYFVKCNKETTTQNDINLGIVNIVVGFAPLKPAEFVIIKLQQIAGQIQV
jgi:phage tail sheath protein FI